MAVVFLAHNGIGVGHLARSLVLCDTLKTLGEKPVVFSQCATYWLGDHQYPGKTIKDLRKASDCERAIVRRDIERYVRMSVPSVVFEDTHPCNLELPNSIRRILIVRPTDFNYLAWLAREYADRYNAFLVGDHPGSPTWIYDEKQTATILQWPKWFVIGPVYRRITEEQRETVMRRHRISIDDPVCVFSLGGGGVRSSLSDEIPKFLHIASEIAASLRRKDHRTRLLFVKGPLFPRNVACPKEFEVVADEPCMPALISISRGAVIRPGFNTTWECLSAGVPFTPVLGTSYREPMEERISRLATLGFVSFNMADRWDDPIWVAERTTRRRAVQAAWPGVPDVTILSRQIRYISTQTSESRTVIRASDAFPGASVRTSLAIRVDDVICLDANLEWLIGILVARQLRASLGAIPYLCRITEADLDTRDPSGLLTVGQHGYAHIPQLSSKGERSEFGTDALPSPLQAGQIASGRRNLIARFPTRFSGGFSAPYDLLAPWLGPLWAELGGKFISCVSENPRLVQVPVVRPLIETWDWSNNEPRATQDVLASVHRVIELSGGAGIVIHPWLLSTSTERNRIEDLLDRIIESGKASLSLADLPVLGRMGYLK